MSLFKDNDSFVKTIKIFKSFLKLKSINHKAHKGLHKGHKGFRLLNHYLPGKLLHFARNDLFVYRNAGIIDVSHIFQTNCH
jgi:hypothetical protein